MKARHIDVSEYTAVLSPDATLLLNKRAYVKTVLTQMKYSIMNFFVLKALAFVPKVFQLFMAPA